MKIFGREPALIAGFAAALIQMVSAFIFPLDAGQQGVLNAAVVALLGLITAFVVRSDGISAAVLGFLNAVLAVGLAFGLALDPTRQAIIMSFAAAVVAMFVRTQEDAPLPATVRAPSEPNTV